MTILGGAALRPHRHWSARLLNGGEQGNALVEMAVVLPAFFLLTFGFIEFCMVMYGMGNANFASRVALRYATLHSSTSFSPTSQTDLNRLVAPYVLAFPSNTYSVTPTYAGGNFVGTQVCVSVTLTYTVTLFSNTYRGITYNSAGCGMIQQ